MVPVIPHVIIGPGWLPGEYKGLGLKRGGRKAEYEPAQRGRI